MEEVVADAIVEGAAVLDAMLAAFETTPSVDQVSSPLELFREALRPVDRALDLANIPLARQGVAEVRLAPWDRFGLAPGSSRVLGRAAHEAHLAWGLRKAEAMAPLVAGTRGPVVGLLCPTSDLSELVSEAVASSYRTVELPSDTYIVVAVVCADLANADAVVRAAAANSRVIVYGRAIDDVAEIRYAALGATFVVPADKLLGHLGEYLPTVA